jgi:hypothetical protein
LATLACELPRRLGGLPLQRLLPLLLLAELHRPPQLGGDDARVD